MKIGLVVGEPKSSAELEAAYGGPQEIEEVEFIEEDDEAAGAFITGDIARTIVSDVDDVGATVRITVAGVTRLRFDLAKCFAALAPMTVRISTFYEQFCKNAG